MIVAIYSNIAVFVQVLVGSVGYSIYVYIVIFRLTHPFDKYLSSEGS